MRVTVNQWDTRMLNTDQRERFPGTAMFLDGLHRGASSELCAEMAAGIQFVESREKARRLSSSLGSAGIVWWKQ